MNDIWTMVWKEWRDSIIPGGKIGNTRSLVFMAFLGVVLPWVDRRGWLSLSTAMLAATILFPYFYILNYIGDAFAGERERHTLETLLASRIPDRAILWGKVIATISAIWGMTVAASLIGCGVANLGAGAGGWHFYAPASSWLAVLCASLLACLLAASAGILVSLHSATTRQAQQTLTLGSLGLFLLLYLLIRALPGAWFAEMSADQLFLIALMALAILDAILLGVARVSFHRAKLIDR